MVTTRILPLVGVLMVIGLARSAPPSPQNTNVGSTNSDCRWAPPVRMQCEKREDKYFRTAAGLCEKKSVCVKYTSKHDEIKFYTEDECKKNCLTAAGGSNWMCKPPVHPCSTVEEKYYFFFGGKCEKVKMCKEIAQQNKGFDKKDECEKKCFRDDGCPKEPDNVSQCEKMEEKYYFKNMQGAGCEKQPVCVKHTKDDKEWKGYDKKDECEKNCLGANAASDMKCKLRPMCSKVTDEGHYFDGDKCNKIKICFEVAKKVGAGYKDQKKCEDECKEPEDCPRAPPQEHQCDKREDKYHFRSKTNPSDCEKMAVCVQQLKSSAEWKGYEKKDDCKKNCLGANAVNDAKCKPPPMCTKLVSGVGHYHDGTKCVKFDKLCTEAIKKVGYGYKDKPKCDSECKKKTCNPKCKDGEECMMVGGYLKCMPKKKPCNPKCKDSEECRMVGGYSKCMPKSSRHEACYRVNCTKNGTQCATHCYTVEKYLEKLISSGKTQAESMQILGELKTMNMKFMEAVQQYLTKYWILKKRKCASVPKCDRTKCQLDEKCQCKCPVCPDAKVKECTAANKKCRIMVLPEPFGVYIPPQPECVSEKKPGKCHAMPGNSNKRMCSSDGECPGDAKCCSNGYGTRCQGMITMMMKAMSMHTQHSMHWVMGKKGAWIGIPTTNTKTCSSDADCTSTTIKLKCVNITAMSESAKLCAMVAEEKQAAYKPMMTHCRRNKCDKPKSDMAKCDDSDKVDRYMKDDDSCKKEKVCPRDIGGQEIGFKDEATCKKYCVKANQCDKRKPTDMKCDEKDKVDRYVKDGDKCKKEKVCPKDNKGMMIGYPDEPMCRMYCTKPDCKPDCGDKQKCVWQKVVCVKAPCFPVPQCVGEYAYASSTSASYNNVMAGKSKIDLCPRECEKDADCGEGSECKQRGCTSMCKCKYMAPYGPCHIELQGAVKQLMYMLPDSVKNLPSCDGDGNYLPMQCDHELGVCKCVKKDGTKLKGWTKVTPDFKCSYDMAPSTADETICPNNDAKECPPLCMLLHMMHPEKTGVHCRVNPCGGCAVVLTDVKTKKVVTSLFPDSQPCFQSKEKDFMSNIRMEMEKLKEMSHEEHEMLVYMKALRASGREEEFHMAIADWLMKMVMKMAEGHGEETMPGKNPTTGQTNKPRTRRDTKNPISNPNHNKPSDPISTTTGSSPPKKMDPKMMVCHMSWMMHEVEMVQRKLSCKHFGLPEPFLKKVVMMTVEMTMSYFTGKKKKEKPGCSMLMRKMMGEDDVAEGMKMMMDMLMIPKEAKERIKNMFMDMVKMKIEAKIPGYEKMDDDDDDDDKKDDHKKDDDKKDDDKKDDDKKDDDKKDDDKDDERKRRDMLFMECDAAMMMGPKMGDAKSREEHEKKCKEARKKWTEKRPPKLPDMAACEKEFAWMEHEHKRGGGDQCMKKEAYKMPQWKYYFKDGKCNNFLDTGCGKNRTVFDSMVMCLKKNIKKSWMFGKVSMKCDMKTGGYATKQCKGDLCWCVVKGKIIDASVRQGEIECAADGKATGGIEVCGSSKPSHMTSCVVGKCKKAYCKTSDGKEAHCVIDPCVPGCPEKYIDEYGKDAKCRDESKLCEFTKSDYLKEDASCASLKLQYFYDKASRTCKPFVNNQCPSNDTLMKFDKKKYCEKKCKTDKPYCTGKVKVCDKLSIQSSCKKKAVMSVVNKCDCQSQLYDKSHHPPKKIAKCEDAKGDVLLSMEDLAKNKEYTDFVNNCSADTQMTDDAYLKCHADRFEAIRQMGQTTTTKQVIMAAHEFLKLEEVRSKIICGPSNCTEKCANVYGVKFVYDAVKKHMCPSPKCECRTSDPCKVHAQNWGLSTGSGMVCKLVGQGSYYGSIPVCRQTNKNGSCPCVKFPFSAVFAESRCNSDEDCMMKFKCCSLGVGRMCLDEKDTIETVMEKIALPIKMKKPMNPCNVGKMPMQRMKKMELKDMKLCDANNTCKPYHDMICQAPVTMAGPPAKWRMCCPRQMAEEPPRPESITYRNWCTKPKDLKEMKCDEKYKKERYFMENGMCKKHTDKVCYKDSNGKEVGYDSEDKCKKECLGNKRNQCVKPRDVKDMKCDDKYKKERYFMENGMCKKHTDKVCYKDANGIEVGYDSEDKCKKECIQKIEDCMKPKNPNDAFNCDDKYKKDRYFISGGKCEKYPTKMCEKDSKGKKIGFDDEDECMKECSMHVQGISERVRMEKMMEMKCIAMAMKGVKDVMNSKYAFPNLGPRCLPDGSFQRIQTWDKFGISWCVNDDGERLKNTVGRMNPKCPKNAGKSKDIQTADVAVCPVGVEIHECDPHMCDEVKCTKVPKAVCRVNPCGKCGVDFFDQEGVATPVDCGQITIPNRPPPPREDDKKRLVMVPVMIMRYGVYGPLHHAISEEMKEQQFQNMVRQKFLMPPAQQYSKPEPPGHTQQPGKPDHNKPNPPGQSNQNKPNPPGQSNQNKPNPPGQSNQNKPNPPGQSTTPPGQPKPDQSKEGQMKEHMKKLEAMMKRMGMGELISLMAEMEKGMGKDMGMGKKMGMDWGEPKMEPGMRPGMEYMGWNPVKEYRVGMRGPDMAMGPGMDWIMKMMGMMKPGGMDKEQGKEGGMGMGYGPGMGKGPGMGGGMGKEQGKEGGMGMGYGRDMDMDDKEDKDKMEKPGCEMRKGPWGSPKMDDKMKRCPDAPKMDSFGSKFYAMDAKMYMHTGGKGSCSKKMEEEEDEKKKEEMKKILVYKIMCSRKPHMGRCCCHMGGCMKDKEGMQHKPEVMFYFDGTKCKQYHDYGCSYNGTTFLTRQGCEMFCRERPMFVHPIMPKKPEPKPCHKQDKSFKRCAGPLEWCVDGNGKAVAGTLHLGQDLKCSATGVVSGSRKVQCTNGKAGMVCDKQCMTNVPRRDHNLQLCTADPCNNCAVKYEDRFGAPSKLEKPCEFPANFDKTLASGIIPRWYYWYDKSTKQCAKIKMDPEKAKGAAFLFRRLQRCVRICGAVEEKLVPACANKQLAFKMCAKPRKDICQCKEYENVVCKVDHCTCQRKLYHATTWEEVTVCKAKDAERTMAQRMYMMMKDKKSKLNDFMTILKKCDSSSPKDKTMMIKEIFRFLIATKDKASVKMALIINQAMMLKVRSCQPAKCTNTCDGANEYGFKISCADCTEHCKCETTDPCKDITCPKGKKCYRAKLGMGKKFSMWPECRAENKPGVCPHWHMPEDDRYVKFECKHDSDCMGRDKCCSTISGTMCTPQDGMWSTKAKHEKFLKMLGTSMCSDNMKHLGSVEDVKMPNKDGKCEATHYLQDRIPANIPGAPKFMQGGLKVCCPRENYAPCKPKCKKNYECVKPRTCTKPPCYSECRKKVDCSPKCGSGMVCVEPEQKCLSTKCKGECRNKPAELKPCKVGKCWQAIMSAVQLHKLFSMTVSMPRCKKNGDFAPVQLNPRTGMSFCVDKISGQMIKGTEIRGIMNVDCTKAKSTGVSKPVCPGDKIPKKCEPKCDPLKSCAKYPQAVCRVNPCGDKCAVEYYYMDTNGQQQVVTEAQCNEDINAGTCTKKWHTAVITIATQMHYNMMRDQKKWKAMEDEMVGLTLLNRLGILGDIMGDFMMWHKRFKDEDEEGRKGYDRKMGDDKDEDDKKDYYKKEGDKKEGDKKEGDKKEGDKKEGDKKEGDKKDDHKKEDDEKKEDDDKKGHEGWRFKAKASDIEMMLYKYGCGAEKGAGKMVTDILKEWLMKSMVEEKKQPYTGKPVVPGKPAEKGKEMESDKKMDMDKEYVELDFQKLIFGWSPKDLETKPLDYVIGKMMYMDLFEAPMMTEEDEKNKKGDNYRKNDDDDGMMMKKRMDKFKILYDHSCSKAICKNKPSMYCLKGLGKKPGMKPHKTYYWDDTAKKCTSFDNYMCGEKSTYFMTIQACEEVCGDSTVMTGPFLPMCSWVDGSYNPKQCRGKTCWCANKAGAVISGTMTKEQASVLRCDANGKVGTTVIKPTKCQKDCKDACLTATCRTVEETGPVQCSVDPCTCAEKWVRTDGTPITCINDATTCTAKWDSGTSCKLQTTTPTKKYGKRYIWHYENGRCQRRPMTDYRGCGGNLNRFNSEDECLYHCTEKMCPNKGYVCDQITPLMTDSKCSGDRLIPDPCVQNCALDYLDTNGKRMKQCDVPGVITNDIKTNAAKYAKTPVARLRCRFPATEEMIQRILGDCYSFVMTCKKKWKIKVSVVGFTCERGSVVLGLTLSSNNTQELKNTQNQLQQQAQSGNLQVTVGNQTLTADKNIQIDVVDPNAPPATQPPKPEPEMDRATLIFAVTIGVISAVAIVLLIVILCFIKKRRDKKDKKKMMAYHNQTYDGENGKYFNPGYMKDDNYQ